MNFDVNTLMTLMSMTGGQGMSGNMQNLLPLLMTMMNKNNAPPSCEQGRPQSFGGASGNGYGTESNQNAFKNNFSQSAFNNQQQAGQNPFFGNNSMNLMQLLPLLAGLSGGKNNFGVNPFAAAKSADAARGFENDNGASDSFDRTAPNERGRTYSRSTEAPRNYGSPFEDIGFAGSEVRGFMEKLWRIRKRI